MGFGLNVLYKPLTALGVSVTTPAPLQAGTDTPGLTEVTQRYADQSVSGIRAAIAAAREAGRQDPETRAAARFALGESPAIKVPSMVLEPRPEPAAQPSDASALGDEAETP